MTCWTGSSLSSAADSVKLDSSSSFNVGSFLRSFSNSSSGMSGRTFLPCASTSAVVVAGGRHLEHLGDVDGRDSGGDVVWTSSPRQSSLRRLLGGRRLLRPRGPSSPASSWPQRSWRAQPSSRREPSWRRGPSSPASSWPRRSWRTQPFSRRGPSSPAPSWPRRCWSSWLTSWRPESQRTSWRPWQVRTWSQSFLFSRWSSWPVAPSSSSFVAELVAFLPLTFFPPGRRRVIDAGGDPDGRIHRHNQPHQSVEGRNNEACGQPLIRSVPCRTTRSSMTLFRGFGRLFRQVGQPCTGSLRCISSW